jgi:hypothetical protein
LLLAAAAVVLESSIFASSMVLKKICIWRWWGCKATGGGEFAFSAPLTDFNHRSMIFKLV